MFEIQYKCSNNEAEYEAFILGLEVLLSWKVKHDEIIGDSLLVVKQVVREYRCLSLNLIKYLTMVARLLYEFDEEIIQHVARKQNYEANDLAQIASKYKVSDLTLLQFCEIKDVLSLIKEREVTFINQLKPSDWRKPNIYYLRNLDGAVDRKIRNRATNYVTMGDTLFKRSFDGGLSMCLSENDAY